MKNSPSEKLWDAIHGGANRILSKPRGLRGKKSHKKSGDAPVKVHPRNPMGLVLLFGAVVTERSEVAQEVQKVRRSNVTIEVHISDTAYIHDALA